MLIAYRLAGLSALGADYAGVKLRAQPDLICAPQQRKNRRDVERVLIPEEAAPQFRDDCAPRNGMKPPPNSEMISPPITE